MTAHELARKLLAGPDYDVVIGDNLQEIANAEFDVRSLNSQWPDYAHTRPVVAIEAKHGCAAVETFSYTRSQTGL